MTTSNQDWYVCLHITDSRRCPEVTTLGCVNISRLINENIRPQLERYRLPQSESDVRNSERYETKEILFKNFVTNNTIHRLEYVSSNCDVFATIDAKFYVMVTNKEGPSFRVYDPSHDSWKKLPPIPISDKVYSSENYAFRHMICVRGSNWYVFDTIEEKWFVPKVALPSLQCAVEFSGFLIGVLHDEGYGSIAAYKLDDDNGLPDANSRHILDDDLWELFYPPATPKQNGSSLQRFGDGKLVLVSNIGDSFVDGKLVIIAVFRVSVSNVSGIPVISAAFEHKQVYRLAKDYPTEEFLNVRSTFLLQNAPRCCSRVSKLLLEDSNGINIRERKRQRMTQSSRYSRSLARSCTPQTSSDDDDGMRCDEKKDKSVVEWDEHLREKSLYMCFVENITDSSVSYIIKAIKFKDLVSTSSPDLSPKLHRVASTRGFHLPCLPSCGVFGSQIIFAGGGKEDYLRELEPTEEDPFYSDNEYNKDVEVPQQVATSRNIYFYDVINSADQIIKRFPSSFKGMKPKPILAEVEGKLYALANSPIPKYMKNSGPSFEVFDAIEKQWSPLPEPPTYTKFQSFSNHHAIVGTNLLSWGGHYRASSKLLSPGLFRFDMAADKDWRLVNSTGALVDDKHWSEMNDDSGSSIVVDIGGGGVVLFGHETRGWDDVAIQVHLISREFESFVAPKLKMPKSVTSLLKAQNDCVYSTFVHLGGSRVCLLMSFEFSGPYSRTMRQFDEVDKMSIVIIVFEFQVSDDRKSVAAEFVFHRVLDYFDDDNADATHADRNPKTSAAHMVGAFLV